MGTNERHGTQEADMKRVKVLTRVPLGIIAATGCPRARRAPRGTSGIRPFLGRCLMRHGLQQVSALRLPIVHALAAGPLVLALSAGWAALAQDRMPPVAPKTYDGAQK